ncbi:MAG TPA: nucleoside triphosphate pyrophosphatase [Guyparkeria sp.]|nr:nucleoside triphosphate pyrophosphatase [Guyparkeria sp.]
MTLTPLLSCPSLWLASGSPRRSALLEQAGYVIAGRARPIEIVDERLLPGESAAAAALRLARAKLTNALADPALPAGAVLLAADTLVVAPDGRPMGKPSDMVEAERMLAALSGQWHGVTTAVTVGNVETHREEVVNSRLRLSRLSPAEIRAYVATGEPLDKAGGYGLQGLAGSFVEEIEGDCTAVIGLPLATARRLLAAFGIRPAWMDLTRFRQNDNGNQHE